MKRVKFGDVVVRANTKEDKNNTEKEFYLDGQYFEGQELEVEKGSPLKGATIGPMFYFGFKSGQVLFMSRSFAIKKAAVARFDGICSEKTFVLETKDSNILLQEYLVFILQNQLFWDYCEENKSGSVNFFINWSTLERYEFDLPDIEEQKRVSDSLWAAYEVKKSYRKMISSIDEMVKSQFIARFGTTEQSAYPVKTLREIALSSGEYGANTPATKYNPEKGRYIRITDIDEFGNLNDDRVSPEVADNKYLLHKGDLLFARTGATVGKTYLHKTSKALYAGYLIKYQFIDTVLPEFVFAYTHSKEYYQWVELTQKVGAQPNISAKQYDGLRIVVPPFEEQKSFVGLMNQADKSKYLS